MKSLGNHFERRPGFARRCIRVIPVLLAGCALCTLVAAEKSPSKKSKADSKAGKDSDKGDKKKGQSESAAGGASAANTGLKSFGQMIPEGSRSRGVRLPAFDNGKPSSLIVADAMTRLDDSRLFAEKMVIHSYAEKKEDDMRIDLKTGIYNMDSLILSSTERSRVSRSDFQIEGDGMVFDTKSSQGKMVGNVEMIIFDADAAQKKMNVTTGTKPPATPAAKPVEADKDKQTNPEEKK